MIMGLEYGYKKNRHIYTAGLRITSMNILEYTFFDTQDAKEYSQIMRSTTFELLLGYGYNFGGTGRISKEKDEVKWIFPAETGLMFNLNSSEDNTDIFVSGGFLRKFTKKMYWGIKGFVFKEGGAPLLSLAVSEDPDKLINNFSFMVFPVDGSVAGALEYNLGIKRISIGAFCRRSS